MPGKALQWSEPVAYSRALYQKSGQGGHAEPVIRAVVVFLGILVLRFVSGMHPSPDAHPPGWIVTAAIALAAALFFSFVLPQLILRMPSVNVIVSHKGINRNRREGMLFRYSFYPWDQISACSFGTSSYLEAPGRELRIHNLTGAVVATAGLSSKPNEHEIGALILSYGKPILPSQ